MCEQCHKDSPDFDNPVYFFNHVLNKRLSHSDGFNLKQFTSELLDNVNVLKKDISTFDSSLIPMIYQNNAGTHGGNYSYSTQIAVLCSCMKSKVS